MRRCLRSAGLLKDSTGKIIDEYTSNNEGYITLKQSIVNGAYTLEQISIPTGCTADKIPKTIDVLNGETTETTRKMYTEGGQIQVNLTSTAYNSTLDLDLGSNLQGGVFDIMSPSPSRFSRRLPPTPTAWLPAASYPLAGTLSARKPLPLISV